MKWYKWKFWRFAKGLNRCDCVGDWQGEWVRIFGRIFWLRDRRK